MVKALETLSIIIGSTGVILSFLIIIITIKLIEMINIIISRYRKNIAKLIDYGKLEYATIDNVKEVQTHNGENKYIVTVNYNKDINETIILSSDEINNKIDQSHVGNKIKIYTLNKPEFSYYIDIYNYLENQGLNCNQLVG